VSAVPPADAELHATVAGRLEAIGQRYTDGRRRLVSALAAGDGPAPMAAIVARARGVPQSSAYRNLSVLEEAGCVHRVPTPDGGALYELDERLVGRHHHLQCLRCGDVVDFDVPASLERALGRAIGEVASSSGFTVEGHRLDLVGRCFRCRQGKRPSTPSTR
jgi:Fur family transcriptional regulator, ferric uptake regulator